MVRPNSNLRGTSLQGSDLDSLDNHFHGRIKSIDWKYQQIQEKYVNKFKSSTFKSKKASMPEPSVSLSLRFKASKFGHLQNQKDPRAEAQENIDEKYM